MVAAAAPLIITMVHGSAVPSISTYGHGEQQRGYEIEEQGILPRRVVPWGLTVIVLAELLRGIGKYKLTARRYSADHDATEPHLRDNKHWACANGLIVGD